MNELESESAIHIESKDPKNQQNIRTPNRHSNQFAPHSKWQIQ